jgi:hypothetical protein
MTTPSPAATACAAASRVRHFIAKVYFGGTWVGSGRDAATTRRIVLHSFKSFIVKLCTCSSRELKCKSLHAYE